MAKNCSSDRPKRIAGALLLAATLACAGCKQQKSVAVPKSDPGRAAHDESLCANQAHVDRLKALAFAQAKDVRSGTAPSLDRLAATATARMERPAVKSRDEALNVVVCTGRLAIALPPGDANVFGGRRLDADIEYAVQTAADGRAFVYRISGGEPIANQLATLDLKSSGLAHDAPAQTAPARTEAESRPPAPRQTRIQVHAPPLPLPVRDAAARSWAHEPRLSARGRPSYDCRFVRSRSEQLICRDERLAALDRVEASLYRRAIDDTGDEAGAALRWSHDRFLARRDRCVSPACVARAYRDRMDEIDRIAAEE